MVHREEIIKAISARFTENGVPHGIIKSGYPYQPWHQVQIASVQTLAARIKRIKNGDFYVPGAPVMEAFGIILTDEAHHSCARQYLTVYAEFPNAILIGTTATAARLDGRPLGDVYQVIVQGPGTKQLIDEGWLSPYALAHGETKIDTSKFHLDSKGEFKTSEMEEVFDKKQLIGEVYDKWAQFAFGKQTLIFAVNRKHARHIQESFEENGVRVAYVDGLTDRRLGGEREQIFNRFALKEITVLVNVDLAGEGVDIPGIDCVVIACATNSLTVWLQAVGRALRPIFTPGMPQDTAEQRKASIAASSKPYAILIDHGWNFERLHLPDHPHEWSLEGRKKRAKPTIGSVKYCSGTMPSGTPCTFVGPSQTRVCPLCGFVFTPTPEMPDHKDGEMVLIMPGAAAPPKPPTKKEVAALLLESQKKYLADHLLIQERKRYLTSGAMNPKYDPKFALKAFKREYEKWPNEKHGVTKEWKREMNTHVGHFVPRLLWWELDGVRYWCEKGVVA